MQFTQWIERAWWARLTDRRIAYAMAGRGYTRVGTNHDAVPTRAVFINERGDFVRIIGTGHNDRIHMTRPTPLGDTAPTEFTITTYPQWRAALRTL